MMTMDVKVLESDMAECEALVRRMDLEARSVHGDEIGRDRLLTQLREYKRELQGLKGEVKTALARRNTSASTANDAARDELLNGAERGGGGGGGVSNLGRQSQAVETTERLARSGERIKESRRALLETEELGSAILQDLQGQRETIERSREALHGADDTISRSRKILSSMGRRASANKLAFYGVVGMLAFAIILIIYYKLS